MGSTRYIGGPAGRWAVTDAACCDPARVVSCERRICEDFSLRISEEGNQLVAWGESEKQGGRWYGVFWLAPGALPRFHLPWHRWVGGIGYLPDLS